MYSSAVLFVSLKQSSMCLPQRQFNCENIFQQESHFALRASSQCWSHFLLVVHWTFAEREKRGVCSIFINNCMWRADATFNCHHDCCSCCSLLACLLPSYFAFWPESNIIPILNLYFICAYTLVPPGHTEFQSAWFHMAPWCRARHWFDSRQLQC